MPTFPTMSSGSMRVVGTLGDNAIAMYPATSSNSYVTRVLQFLGDQEQRWIVRKELFAAVLEFKGVNGYDMSVIRDFFESRLGPYVPDSLDTTFDFTFTSTTYSYCAFVNDKLQVEVNRGESYSFELRIAQVRPN